MDGGVVMMYVTILLVIVLHITGIIIGEYIKAV
jgi:cytochrome b subunit of formate dehydrogenase